jgi:hypothetical protein
MKNNVKILCVAVFLGGAFSLSAQEDKKKELNREMTLEREFDPTVQDANKVNTLPEVKEPVVKKTPIDFSTYTTALEPDKELTTLPSGKIDTDIAFNKRRGYFNFGGGTYLNLNGDLGYHILSTEKDRLGVWFSHRSTNGNVKYLQIDEKQKAKVNDNIGGLDFKHVFAKNILELGAKYGYSTFNYYGLPYMQYTSQEDLSKILNGFDRDTNQGEQTVAFNLGLSSKEERGFLYEFNVGYTNFSRKYGLLVDMDGIKQNTVDVDLDLSAGFNGNMRVGLEGKVGYSAYSDIMYEGEDFSEYENSVDIALSPYYKVEGENWGIKLGAKLLYTRYGDEGKISAAPNVEANVTVADKTQLYLNADGGLISNTAYDISRSYRYINPILGIEPSINNLDARVGIKSGVAPGFWFDIYGGYNITNDDFLLSTQYYDDFADDLSAGFYNALLAQRYDTKRFFVGVNLKYAYQETVEFGLKGQYNGWTVKLPDDLSDTDLSLKAFGKPDTEINASVTLRPFKGLSASLNYYLGTGRYTDIIEGNSFMKMKNINELNLTGNYTLNDTFGIYLKLTNVLCQKYDIYYGYPAQSIGAMVGINLNF